MQKPQWMNEETLILVKKMGKIFKQCHQPTNRSTLVSNDTDPKQMGSMESN